jgi:hypothetical protein
MRDHTKFIFVVRPLYVIFVFIVCQEIVWIVLLLSQTELDSCGKKMWSFPDPGVGCCNVVQIIGPVQDVISTAPHLANPRDCEVVSHIDAENKNKI